MRGGEEVEESGTGLGFRPYSHIDHEISPSPGYKNGSSGVSRGSSGDVGLGGGSGGRVVVVGAVNM